MNGQFQALIRACYGSSTCVTCRRVIWFVIRGASLFVLILLTLFAKLSQLSEIDYTNADFWFGWSWGHRLLFISFWNQLRALARSDDDVLELLEVLSPASSVPNRFKWV